MGKPGVHRWLTTGAVYSHNPAKETGRDGEFPPGGYICDSAPFESKGCPWWDFWQEVSSSEQVRISPEGESDLGTPESGSLPSAAPGAAWMTFLQFPIG
jgi:hypothetical protein